MFSAMRHHQNVDLDIDGNASKPHISIFDENEIFAKICFGYHKCQWFVPSAKSIKMTKMEVANTLFLVCFETVFCVF